MSSFLGMAAVTATLRNLLQRAFDLELAGATVTTRPPDRAGDFGTGTGGEVRLNLFLYAAQPNAAWRNQDPPRTSRPGETAFPPLALDLYYLLTAVERNDGDANLPAQRALALALRTLHEQPLLGADAIAAALPGADAGRQIERLRITHHPLSTEELSKLWTTFQSPYRLSAAVQASVLLVDNRRSPAAAPPVTTRNLQVLPFLRPVLESVEPQIATPGGPLVLRGLNLRGTDPRVLVDATEVVPSRTEFGEAEITLPSSLPAGVHTVQLVHRIAFGTPADPHRGPASNLIAFLLAPSIQPVAPAITFSAAVGGTLNVAVTPAVGASQSAALLVGDRFLPLPDRAPGSPALAQVSFDLPASLGAGAHLLRLRVDGADSPFSIDTNPASATFGRITGPHLTLA